MSLRSTVETLGRTAVTTTFTAVRHPFGTAARAAGLAKHTAGAGLGLVRGRSAPVPAQGHARDRTAGTTAAQDKVAEVTQTVLTSVAQVVETVAEKAEEAAALVEPEGAAVKQAAAVKKAAAEEASPKVKTPPAKKPASKKPASEKPASKKPASEKPASEKPASKKPASEKPASKKVDVKAPPAGKAATGGPVVEKVSTGSTDEVSAKKAEDPRDHIPGPDLVTFAPPAPEDLPEPIVIEAQ